MFIGWHPKLDILSLKRIVIRLQAHLYEWVVGSGDGAGYFPVPGRSSTLAYGRAGACCACSRCGKGGPCFFFFFFLISSILSSFSYASSVGRRLDTLKYCGLGRSNPAVVVSYYRRRAR